MSIPKFFILMTEVAKAGQAWGHIRDEGTFSERTVEHKMFKVLGYLMSISADSNWLRYTVQQWLRAGAWYLALVG